MGICNGVVEMMNETRTISLDSARKSSRARAFTMMEVLVVAAILGLFASMVIPQFAKAHEPVATLLEHTLEADLRLARTEAMTRARPVSLVVSADGSSWWIADHATLGTPVGGLVRTCGQSSLYELAGVSLLVKRDADGTAATSASGVRVLATFDSLGARDGATVDLAARDANGAIVGEWTILAGRTRLSHLRGN